MAYGNPYPGYYPGYYAPNSNAVPDMMGQYKSQYQPQMQQMPQQPQPAQQTSDIIWVQGEAGAKSYLIAPGSTVMLMDSESNTFYFKSADASGMPMPLRIFDYVERTQPKGPQHSEQYASAATVQAMADEIAALRQKIEALSAAGAAES